jgi:TonB-linked SusC/RagA family outer membrane protein
MLKIKLKTACLRKRVFGTLAGLFFMSLAVPVQAQTEKVSLSVRDQSIASVLQKIEKQTNYTFFYKNEQLLNKPKVTLTVENEPLNQLLVKVLSPAGLIWVVDDKVIVLKVNQNEQPKGVSNIKKILTGRVVDERGEPLPGCTITEKGQAKAGAISGAEGDFMIQLNDVNKAVLVVSFVGMKTREVLVANQNNIQVVLSENSVMLNDYVILGYGMAQKKTDLVGSAYQVSSKKIEALPAGRIDNLLDGLVPGLQITFNSDGASNPNPRLQTRVRGQTSLDASCEPIWIVDGVRIYTGDKNNQVTGMSMTVSPLSYISSEDIESFTVLKDASATSLYGADGANGVILVTTKKGSAGKSQLSFSALHGVSHINESTRFKVLDASQYMTLAKEAWTNAGKDISLFPFQDNDMNTYSTTNTNWADVYYGQGSTDEINLTFRGGKDNVKFYIAGGYFNDKSTIMGNEQKRYSMRSNMDLALNKRTNVHLNSYSSFNVADIFNPGNDYYEILPIFTPYNADGSYRLYNKLYDYESGSTSWKTQKFWNSVAEREDNDNRQRSFSNNTTLSLDYQLLPSLQFTSQFGVNFQSSFEDIYYASTNWTGISTDGYPDGSSTRSNANFLLWTAVQRLNYQKSFGKHRLGGVVGFEANSQNNYSLSGSGYGFANDHIKEISSSTNYEDYVSSSASATRSMSFLAQVNYSYDNRYYAVLNGRRDGSSSFGSDVQWGNFGSLGLSWNMHNESFYALSNVNVFKWKLSYGVNGNSRLGSQQAQGLYTYSSSYAGEAGGEMAQCPNPSLSWETTHMLNAGLRLRFFDRLDIDLEAYNNLTLDLLTDLDVSRLTGDTRVKRNMGSMQNRGIEATIGIDVIKSDPLNWNFELNMAHSKNKVLKLYNGISKVMGNKIWMEGEDVNVFYLIRWAGVDPQDGAPLWYDADGNVTRTYDSDNRVPYKSSSPDVSGGFTNTVSYRNWSLSSVAAYVIGGYAFSSFGRNVSSDGLNILDQNQSVNQLDRWQEPGDIASTPKLVYGNSSKSMMNSTRYLYNTTHLLLRNVSLSYGIPLRWVSPIGLSNARVSLTGDNLGLWTPYDHKDRNSYRQCMSGYPMETSWTVGLSCIF